MMLVPQHRCANDYAHGIEMPMPPRYRLSAHGINRTDCRQPG
jgi:hypothetical protein